MAEYDNSMSKTRARKAINGSYKIIEEDEDKEVGEDEGTDEPAGVVGLAKEEEKKDDEKGSGWGKKVAAAIAGIGGAVAGANLQYKRNQQREKMYQAKRKTGNYL